jgi:membrane associated rhomboid family serine protease
MAHGLPSTLFTRLRIPPVVAALIAVTAVVSIAAALGSRNGAPGLATGGLLWVPAVWHGEVWRLVTWVLFETDPLALLFACLTLYWVGSDLARMWGPRRFVGFYFGVAAVAGALTALLGLVWSPVAAIPQGGSWAVLDALVIAWGLRYADREIRLWGVVRLTGRQIVWLTIGVTVLYALFRGLAAYVPNFFAELMVLGWMGPWLRRRATPRRHEPWSFETWLARNRR